MPRDREIDGIDVSDFLLGKQPGSGREGFVVYMGQDIFAVKWRNWKLHFKEQGSVFGELRSYTMPRVYNLHTGPREIKKAPNVSGPGSGGSRAVDRDGQCGTRRPS